MVIVMDLPSYKMVIFHSYVNVYQRVSLIPPNFSPSFWPLWNITNMTKTNILRARISWAPIYDS